MCEEWYYKPEWWSAIGTILAAIITLFAAIIALLLGIAGIFKKWVKGLFIKPKFDINVSTDDPYLVRADFRDEQNQFIKSAYFLNLKIENSGCDDMVNAVAVVVSVFTKTGKVEVKQPNFTPSYLVIANFPHKFIIPRIQPTLFNFFSIGHFEELNNTEKVNFMRRYGLTEKEINSNIIFKFSLPFEPNYGYHILSAGEYEITIKFAANNCKVNTKYYLLKFEDHWEKELFDMKKHISIKETKNWTE